MDDDYEASANSFTSIRFSHEGAVLTARCILLGSTTICSVGNILFDSPGDPQEVLGRSGIQFIIWLTFCASSLYDNEFEEPETSEDLFAVFYETVLVGYFAKYATRTWPLPEFIKYCKWVASAMKNEAPDWDLPWTGDQVNTLILATSNRLQLFSIEIQEPTNPTQSSDQSVVSRNPRKSIGRGDLKFAKDGDIVAIVHGCKLPILLRKEDKGYSVLSGFYFYGFMHGEAIGQYPEKDTDLI